jgi:hypothetical protein
MHKVINAVAPSLAPRMGIENNFERRGRVMFAAEAQCLGLFGM